MEGEEPPWGDHIGGKKRSDGSRKRRFSNEQVRSLECMFEAQTTLEPRRKAQLAGELGLHPRQVAVWFQNRRARWKSKQLEREYDALRADYGALLSSFDSLKKEKQTLSAQLHKLAESLEKHLEESSDSGHCGDGSSKGKEDMEETKPSWLPVEESVDEKLVDNCSGYTGKQEATCLGVSGPINSPLECCFTASSSSGQSCTSSDWWELWP